MNRRGSHPAFTMIELVLVVVVLAVTAGAIIPRLVSRDRRREELAAAVVRDAVSAAARREDFTSGGAALEFDRQAGALSVLTPAPSKVGEWNRAIVWQPDPLVPAATLAPLELAGAYSDGVRLPESRWRLVLSGLDHRPELRLVLRGSATGAVWVVLLPSDAAGASMFTGDEFSARSAGSGTSVDLDRLGLRDAPW
jgi:type II secretory pathway pseudopilin PulG